MQKKKNRTSDYKFIFNQRLGYPFSQTILTLMIWLSKNRHLSFEYLYQCLIFKIVIGSVPSLKQTNRIIVSKGSQKCSEPKTLSASLELSLAACLARFEIGEEIAYEFSPPLQGCTLHQTLSQTHCQTRTRDPF